MIRFGDQGLKGGDGASTDVRDTHHWRSRHTVDDGSPSVTSARRHLHRRRRQPALSQHRSHRLLRGSRQDATPRAPSTVRRTSCREHRWPPSSPGPADGPTQRHCARDRMHQRRMRPETARRGVCMKRYQRQRRAATNVRSVLLAYSGASLSGFTASWKNSAMVSLSSSKSAYRSFSAPSSCALVNTSSKMLSAKRASQLPMTWS